jgi:hypothetical protein
VGWNAKGGGLRLQERIFDGHLEEVEDTLLLGPGPNMLGNFGPIISVQLNGLEEQELVSEERRVSQRKEKEAIGGKG